MFEQPHEVDDATATFGASLHGGMIPPYKDIPDEFKRGNSPYVEFQRKWFFSGLSREEFPEPKKGIDGKAAIRHLAAIQKSFEPSHEHKEAAVAYLASLWLKKPKLSKA